MTVTTQVTVAVVLQLSPRERLLIPMMITALERPLGLGRSAASSAIMGAKNGHVVMTAAVAAQLKSAMQNALPTWTEEQKKIAMELFEKLPTYETLRQQQP